MLGIRSLLFFCDEENYVCWVLQHTGLKSFPSKSGRSGQGVSEFTHNFCKKWVGGHIPTRLTVSASFLFTGVQVEQYTWTPSLPLPLSLSLSPSASFFLSFRISTLMRSGWPPSRLSILVRGPDWRGIRP